jgi:hypothetical protein
VITSSHDEPAITPESALADRLEARRDELARAALAVMLNHEFWQARFGERARRHGLQDGLYHVAYLCEALRAGSPAPLEHYARWLQGVLTTRGMCSRHLADNFATLAEAIGRADVAEAEPAFRYLARATEALRYDDEAPRAVQDASWALAGGVVAALAEPGWTEAQRARHVDDLRYHIDYLADAVALARPQLFAAYVAFIAGFLEQRGVPRALLRRALELLTQQLASTLSPRTAAACGDALGLALRGLGP